MLSSDGVKKHDDGWLASLGSRGSSHRQDQAKNQDIVERDERHKDGLQPAEAAEALEALEAAASGAKTSHADCSGRRPLLIGAESRQIHNSPNSWVDRRPGYMAGTVQWHCCTARCCSGWYTPEDCRAV
jgi:hypothetical protein